jgi:hypothetical protein
MRTWKQGAVGRIDVEDGTTLFVRCLKFPMAQIYGLYDSSSSALAGWICDAKLEVSVLRHITRLAVLAVTKAELNEGSPSAGGSALGIHELIAKVNSLER